MIKDVFQTILVVYWSVLSGGMPGWGDVPGVFNDVGEQLEYSLGANHWHYRLPFYAVEINDDTVDINGNTQMIMNKEIEYAYQAGINYWAFLAYPESWDVSDALKLYLSSEEKNKVKFCITIDGSHLMDEDNQEYEIQRYLEYFSNPYYQDVMDNRPLVYFLDPETATKKLGGVENTIGFFKELEERSIIEGYGEPYFVVMGSVEYKNSLGLDASSAYAYWDGTTEGKRYIEHTEYVESIWYNNLNNQIIPLVSTGWDNRPRYEHPLSWDSGGEAYVDCATPNEIANHLLNAISYVKENTENCPAKAILIYAWNEFDEGGWICPTLYNGKDRLDAISNILGNGEISLIDPGFENGINHLHSQDCEISEETSKVHSGSKAIKIHKRQNPSSSALISIKSILMKHGKGEYNTSAWVKYASQTSTTSIHIKVRDDSGEKWFRTKHFTIGIDYSQISDDLDISWRGNLYSAVMYINSYRSVEDMYLDDVNFVKIH